MDFDVLHKEILSPQLASAKALIAALELVQCGRVRAARVQLCDYVEIIVDGGRDCVRCPGAVPMHLTRRSRKSIYDRSLKDQRACTILQAEG